MPSNNIKIIFALLAIVIILIFPSITIAFSVHAQTVNPKNAVWTSGKPSPVSKMESAYARIDDKIYIIAGYGETGKRNKNSVEVYDAKTDTWNTSGVAPLPVNVNHAAAVAYNGKIYLAGGFLDNKILSDKLFIYDPVENKWQEGKSMPTARAAATAQFIDGILYVVGGTANKPLNNNEAYDPKTDTWKQLAPIPTARGGIAAAVVNGNIYVFGGEAPDKTFNNNEKYDPKTNTWTEEPPMPTARHGLAAIAIGSKIYVIGGGPEPDISFAKVNEIFNAS